MLHCFLLQCSEPYSFSQNEVQVLSRCSENRRAALLVSLGRNDSLLPVYPVNQYLFEKKKKETVKLHSRHIGKKNKLYTVLYLFLYVLCMLHCTVYCTSASF